ncbi:sensor histidine kinase [Streptomyces somaliensis]|uniref:sensor histidine kinase n=1 Tax=Streptomyces somaliensis TaxID=78355 RepID=UPI0020CF7904|nr:sensor histidine kinase [Streptomyces somaliensis]MCP9944554.1 sensor histidine kinase [Streptomyces somaliensis]MCP9975039.1 sensor histidine kinase [Streptomyces somaliensis]
MTPFRPHRDDVLLASAGLAGGLLLWSLGVFNQGARHAVLDAPWAVLPPLLVTASLELLRRVRPRTALLAGTVAVVADQFTRGNIATILMFTDLVYAAVVYGPPASARRLPVTTGLVTVAVSVASLAWYREPWALLIGVLTGMVSFVPAVTGVVVRNHRQAADTARLRAEQTALLAEMDRREAVVAERARMARELHDMVAGHLSAIAIHSTAALSLDDPATSREALGVIRENSVEGLAEMRRLISLLRDSGADGEPAPAPTLAGLSALVRQAGAHGTANGLTFTLTAPPPDGDLPAPVELAAYRIVQESLTNALKHAGAGGVDVVVERTGHALTIVVTSPLGRPAGPRAPGSGAGLVGMRERVALLGGKFEAGPANRAGHGTWRVRAVLPVAEDDREPTA